MKVLYSVWETGPCWRQSSRLPTTHHDLSAKGAEQRPRLQVTDKKQSRQAVKEFQKHEQKFTWHTGLDKGQTKHLISIPPVATKNIKQTDKQINLPSELRPAQPKDPFLDYLGKLLPVDVNENRKWPRLASQPNRAQGISITAFFFFPGRNFRVYLV